MILIIVMTAFVVLSFAALGLLDSASARIAEVFRNAWERLK